MEINGIRVFSLVLWAVSAFACSSRPEMETVVLDVDRATDYPVVVQLSDVASSVRYVSLADDSILLGEYILHVQPVGTEWLVADSRQCVMFDADGKFLRRIGRSGNGPGEYNGIGGIRYDAGKNLIYLAPQRKRGMLVYKPDGTFVERLFPDNRFETWAVSDHVIFSQVDNRRGDAVDKLLALSPAGDTLQRIPNYDFFTLDLTGSMLSLNSRGVFSVGNDRMLYNQTFNDTVYRIGSDYALTPAFIFQISAAHKADAETRANGQKYMASEKDMIVPWCIAETERYLFAGMLRNRQPGIHPYYYDKNAGRFEALGNGTEKGFKNDLDGGLSFFPEYVDPMRNEGYMLLASTAVLDFRKEHPEWKIPEEVKALKEESNPVLVVATFHN